MTVAYLIDMCERRLVALGAQKHSAEVLGDLQQVELVDAQISETAATLNQLRTLG